MQVGHKGEVEEREQESHEARLKAKEKERASNKKADDHRRVDAGFRERRDVHPDAARLFGGEVIKDEDPGVIHVHSGE